MAKEVSQLSKIGISLLEKWWISPKRRDGNSHWTIKDRWKRRIQASKLRIQRSHVDEHKDFRFIFSDENEDSISRNWAGVETVSTTAAHGTSRHPCGFDLRLRSLRLARFCLDYFGLNAPKSILQTMISCFADSHRCDPSDVRVFLRSKILAWPIFTLRLLQFLCF